METPQNCALRLIYTCNPIDVEHGIHIGSFRHALGEELGRQVLPHLSPAPDYVVPVPNSGLYYAMGFSKATGIPYIQALVKIREGERTLAETDLVKRGKMIRRNLVLLPDVLRGKRVVLVDEAIFTGTTLRLVCEKLRGEGVASVSICIPTSPCVGDCPALPQKELLARRMSPGEMCRDFQADGLWFLESGAFRRHTSQFGAVCTRCFL